jgi:hypothetical protein
MNRDALFIKMVLHAWNLNIARATKAFNSFTDDELYLEVAPGKNRIIYLLGHLTTVHDMMLPLLGLGERHYTQLDEAFINNPDRETVDLPSAQLLREHWVDINAVLTANLNSLTADDWFSKHTIVSDNDFAKEPHRNKLSIVITRTNHIAYHLGQIALVKK